MSTLYELQGQWREFAQKLADMNLEPQELADTLEGSDEQMALEEKLQGYEMVARNIEASVPAIKAEIKRLQALGDSLERRAEVLRARVKMAMGDMGLRKVQSPLFAFSIRTNPEALLILDEDVIPKGFWKQEPTLDKAAIKTALQDGGKVEGAMLVRRESLQIK